MYLGLVSPLEDEVQKTATIKKNLPWKIDDTAPLSFSFYPLLMTQIFASLSLKVT